MKLGIFEHETELKATDSDSRLQTQNSALLALTSLISNYEALHYKEPRQPRHGDVQWMTAGRGIIHQEMPKGDPLGQMHGFQLWANVNTLVTAARSAPEPVRRRNSCAT